MNETPDQVRSLWIPLREVNMLLPHAAVAEVGSYRMPRQGLWTQFTDIVVFRSLVFSSIR